MLLGEGDLGSRQLEASLLSAKYMGSLASLRPGCVVVVAVRDFRWRPKALKQQHLRLGKAALL